MIEHSRMYNKFYESYWDISEGGGPEADPTTPERLTLLQKTLAKYFGSGKLVQALDAGCGTGFFTQALTSLKCQSTEIDISRQAIAKAQERYPDLSFHIGPLEGPLPFADGSFDVIFSTEVIEHIYGVYEMLNEFHRILRHDGVLILTTPYHGLIKHLLVVLFNFDKHFNSIKSGHIRFFSKKSLTTILGESGFRVEEIHRFGRLLPCLAKSMYVVATKVAKSQG